MTSVSENYASVLPRMSVGGMGGETPYVVICKDTMFMREKKTKHWKYGSDSTFMFNCCTIELLCVLLKCPLCSLSYPVIFKAAYYRKARELKGTTKKTLWANNQWCKHSNVNVYYGPLAQRVKSHINRVFINCEVDFKRTVEIWLNENANKERFQQLGEQIN